MSMLAQTKANGFRKCRVQLSALVATLIGLGACDGANQGVQIGTGSTQDPVAIDFPIAYVKAPLQFDEDDGELVQTDLRELVSFDFGADLYVKDRAAPGAPPINITGDLTQGLAAIRDVEMAFDGSAVVFAMRYPGRSESRP